MKINRRKMLAIMAAGGSRMPVHAQEKTQIVPSLYIPKAQQVEDRKLLQDFMDEYSFVDLVTSLPTLRITHIPVMLDRTAGPYGKIFGHISRHNPQSETFDGQHTCVVVFRGPHGYISPAWYAKAEAVPTWNFAVVHATGQPKAITEKIPLHNLLARLIDKYESYQGSSYDFSKLPENFVSSMMAGIVGFEMEIESLEGKFKLGQDRNESDRQSLLEHLRQSARPEQTLFDLTASFYRRPKQE